MGGEFIRAGWSNLPDVRRLSASTPQTWCQCILRRPWPSARGRGRRRRSGRAQRGGRLQGHRSTTDLEALLYRKGPGRAFGTARLSLRSSIRGKVTPTPCAGACKGNREDRSLFRLTGFQILHWLRTSMWFWPLVCIASGIAVSVASVSIDRAFDGALVPRWLTGGPDAALEILGTVAGSMVSLTALVLTVVLVVIQLGMGQFSPRIVAEILQDKPSQFAIGIFVGTFAHAMLALSQVSTAEGNEFVPGRRDPGRLRARHHQHHGAGPLCEPHRPQAPGRVADRSGRHADPCEAR